MDPKNSIEFHHVSKHFKIYHEKRQSIFELISSFSKKNKFEEISILDNVSFSVSKGEMLGIIGFNGAGKTTLLKLIANILTPNGGKIETDGKITPFLALGAGFNVELTAYDNIVLYGVLLGFSKNEIIKRIPNITKFANLEKFLDTRLKNFSSGMSARLAFSTAIEVDPDILLVDEVLAVGDMDFREKSFNAFLEFKKKNKSIIFVSHDTGQIMELCDKVLWLHQGKIMSYGSPEKVVKEYMQFVNKT